MPITLNELESFRQFAAAAIQTGPRESLDELLDEWRLAHPSPEDVEADVAAVAAAIRDMEAGDRGRDAREVIEEIRQKLNSRSL